MAPDIYAKLLRQARDTTHDLVAGAVEDTAVHSIVGAVVVFVRADGSVDSRTAPSAFATHVALMGALDMAKQSLREQMRLKSFETREYGPLPEDGNESADEGADEGAGEEQV